MSLQSLTDISQNLKWRLLLLPAKARAALALIALFLVYYSNRVAIWAGDTHRIIRFCRQYNSA